MATKNAGTLIKEARTAKKLSQEALASAIDGLSASDVGKAERGEKELSQAQLKAIAKVLGITQKSLLEAPKGGTTATAAAKKNETTAKKTTTAAKKTTSSAATKKADDSLTLSAAEKKLIELYRGATSDNKKLATRILKGEKLELGDLLPILMANGTIGEDGLLGGLMGKLQGFMK